jgi:hypothetical protein
MGAAYQTAEQFKAGLEDTASAADEARKSTDLFKNALDLLTGEARDITEVEAAFWEELDKASTALENATGAVLDDAGALNLHSDAGRKTRDTLVGLASDADEWIATMKTQGASTDDLRAKDAELRDAFYQTALRMTGNATTAQALTDKYYGIPEQRNTLITADTGQATGAVSRLQTLIDNLRGKTVYIDAVTRATNTVGKALSGTGLFGAMGGIVHAYAGGGFEPMQGGIARIVAPQTFRVIGDRVRDDEAYIPINGSARSRAIFEQTAERMGYSIGGGGGPMVHVDTMIVPDRQHASETAEALAFLARTHG